MKLQFQFLLLLGLGVSQVIASFASSRQDSAIVCPRGGFSSSKGDKPALIANFGKNLTIIICSSSLTNIASSKEDTPSLGGGEFNVYLVKGDREFFDIFSASAVEDFRISFDRSKNVLVLDKTGIPIFRNKLKCTEEKCELSPTECIVPSEKIDPKALDTFLARQSNQIPEGDKVFHNLYKQAILGDKRAKDFMRKALENVSSSGAGQEDLLEMVGNFRRFEAECNGKQLEPTNIELKRIVPDRWSEAINAYYTHSTFNPSLDVTASSSLPNNGSITYSPKNLTNSDMNTAWCFNNSKGGVGEWLELKSPNSWPYDCGLRGIGIVPGYAKSPSVYLNNGRPNKITVKLCNGSRKEVTIPIQVSNDFLESVYIADDVLEEPIVDGKFCLKVKIAEVIPGRTSKDVCISKVIPIVKCAVSK